MEADNEGFPSDCFARENMNPKISIAIPIHDTPKTAYFLARMMRSLEMQTFTDYEVVITKEGKMAHNHNAAILKSKGELVKMMQMDDYFAYPTALQEIVDNFDHFDHWMITGCEHSDGSEHFPTWNDNIFTGANTLGGFSTLTFRNSSRLLLEEPLQWVVDCDLYYRYYLMYGRPKMLLEKPVVVDTRDDRLTHTIPDKLKSQEVDYLLKKYAR